MPLTDEQLRLYLGFRQAAPAHLDEIVEELLTARRAAPEIRAELANARNAALDEAAKVVNDLWEKSYNPIGFVTEEIRLAILALKAPEPKP